VIDGVVMPLETPHLTERLTSANDPKDHRHAGSNP
jgi:hypothetical protein